MINEISFIFRKNKLGTCVDPQQEACNLPSPKESWLRNKHTGPYALLPLHRRQLTSKIGKRLHLPHVVLLPRQKEILRKLQHKGLGLSQNSCAWGGPLLHLPHPVGDSLASALGQMGSGSAYAHSTAALSLSVFPGTA